MILKARKQHVFADFIATYQQRRMVRIAIGRAYNTFDRKHPQWTASLFDRHFIGQTVALWLTTAQPMYKVLTPHLLAAAWAAQLCAQPDRQRALTADCLSVAAEFLQLLQGELETMPTILPIFVQNNIEGFNRQYGIKGA